MSQDDVPELDCRYSRMSQLGFGTAFLILAYGGFGMVIGQIAAEPDARLLQVVIGLVFLVFAAGLGFATLQMFLAARQPILSIGRDGVWDRRLTGAPVPLSAITGVEGIEPGFLERLVLPRRRSGKLVLTVRPEAWDAIPFSERLHQRLLVLLFCRRGRLRIFHRTLDISYPALLAALNLACDRRA